jgi:chemotaxis protein MotB
LEVGALTRKKAKTGGVGTGWLMTFSDMITLLLCFFVLLNIMSTIDADKFKKLVENLNGSRDIFTVTNAAALIGNSGFDVPPDIPRDDFDVQSDDWLWAAYDMKGTIADWGLGNGISTDDKTGMDSLITIEVSDAAIIIRCQNDDGVLFNSGRDELLPGGIEILEFIVEQLVLPHWNLASELRIEGYADERPFQGKYGNLWLSVRRATSAYIHIVEKYDDDIPIETVSPSGYGEHRPLEWLEGETRDEWLQRNRRVEFVLMRKVLLDEETGEGYERR